MPCQDCAWLLKWGRVVVVVEGVLLDRALYVVLFEVGESPPTHTYTHTFVVK